VAGRHLFTSSAGIRHTWVDEGATKRIVSTQDAEPMLDRNKAMATHNDGYTPDRTMRRVASIPAIARLKWLQEEGWDCYQTHDPDVLRKLKQKLNSSEYLYLRTAPGVL
jgi:hypothetical protein